MKIGYLHIGHREDGIRRYGRLLAEAAKRQEGLEVIEADVTPTLSLLRNRRKVVAAARALNAADVVHLQYQREIWGGKRWDLHFLKLFARHCERPVVFTVHDVFTDDSSKKALLSDAGVDSDAVNPDHAIRIESVGVSPLWRFRSLLTSPPVRPRHGFPTVWRWISQYARHMIVCTEDEARRLASVTGSQRIDVIPHFVEERELPGDPSRVREELGLDSFRVVTLLGWIAERKGHPLLLEAMASLPEDVQVVFAGRTYHGFSGVGNRILARARELGVADRLRITGYLPDSELSRYLVATHLAVCPFTGMSASGSVSTWISAGIPILASDLPQIAELNRIEPGTIRTFSPYTPEALASAIQDALSEDDSGFVASTIALREKLRIGRILERHVACFAEALDPPSGPAKYPPAMVAGHTGTSIQSG